jgi:uracil-DNA glycosylase
MKSWKELIIPFQKSQEGQKLKEFLTERRKKAIVWPESANLFAAFNDDILPFDKVRIVIIGQDPYPSNHAHGLSFSSCQNTIPESLQVIFEELHRSLYSYLNKEDFAKWFGSPNLTNWMKQGILLMNRVMTVEEKTASNPEPIKHAGKGWEVFTNEIIKELDADDNPKVFMLWGKDAMQCLGLFKNSKHLILTGHHPAAQKYNPENKFVGNDHFMKALDFLGMHYEHKYKNYNLSYMFDTNALLSMIKGFIKEEGIPFYDATPVMKRIASGLFTDGVKIEFVNELYYIDFRTNYERIQGKD